MEFGSQIVPSKLTTAERNALPVVVGGIIWNTDTKKLEQWDGTTWSYVGLTYADIWAIQTLNNC